VIARAVEQSAPGVVGQIAEQRDVLAVRLERLQNARQFTERPFVIRIPAVHDDAVGHVHEGHAHRRSGARGGQRRDHGVQERKRDGCAHAAQECAPGEGFLGYHR
jgi:hypothetical protein